MMRPGQILKNYWTGILSLLYRHQCLSCSTPLGLDQTHLCLACHKSLRLLEGSYCIGCGEALFLPITTFAARCAGCQTRLLFFDQIYSLMEFNPVVRKLLHQLKYQRKDWLICVFMSAFKQAQLQETLLASFDALVPVPLSWTRYYQRGFNQAQLIGKMLQQFLRKPLLKRLIKRKTSLAQSHLKRKDRLTKQFGTFKIRNSQHIRGKRLILVDDVITTGATANESARVLKEAGAREVLIFSLARTFRPTSDHVSDLEIQKLVDPLASGSMPHSFCDRY